MMVNPYPGYFTDALARYSKLCSNEVPEVICETDLLVEYTQDVTIQLIVGSVWVEYPSEPVANTVILA